MTENGFSVTPWDVQGDVNYDKLIKEFGTEPITDPLIERIKKHTGDLHFMLRRKTFFTHRDMNWLLDEYEKGNKFYLYTGRGPSEHVHLGHIVPWFFTKWLQEKFDVKLIFQLTDDEKFLFKEKLELKDTYNYAIENALDIIALGFDSKKTEILIDTDNAKTLYNAALPISKKLTFSTVKSSFGFTNSNNLGQIFYTCIQAVPSILESIRQGENVPCLIPHAIDQDPHFRLSRDVLPKLGFYKPASIQCKFFPGLQGAGGKMSASEGQTIFINDSAKKVKSKINKYAFSGGKVTIEEHRKLGGNPDIDVSFQYLNILFEPDDKKLSEIYEQYKSGHLLSGELKAILIDKINTFLKSHKEKREKARDQLDKFLIKD
ncbi:MAG: Tryptophan--tRNA ligase [Candidatus Heimdallarchaeota archaeon LC_3]|nr:MAG: Tryptophan--tRNA ligase [Candidatus Heimdallarchaeota archaeon LC_3]